MPFFLRAVGAGRFGLLFAIGYALLWLLFRNSSITLDGQGFTYHSVVRRIAHRWLDIERFSVVEQRMYGLITVSRYLGWTFSPAYEKYKRLGIPRTIARWAGTTDAMFKPVGFDVPKLTRVLNEHLQSTRSGRLAEPAP